MIRPAIFILDASGSCAGQVGVLCVYTFFFFDMANSLLGEHLRMENREVVWIVEEEEMKDGC